MTHDEINALPVDRLVAEVAVQVMGWMPECVVREPAGLLVRLLEGSPNEEYWRPDKHYFDLAMVHKRIRELGKAEEFTYALWDLIDGSFFEYDTAAPLDHLRAALMAVQERSEQ